MAPSQPAAVLVHWISSRLGLYCRMHGRRGCSHGQRGFKAIPIESCLLKLLLPIMATSQTGSQLRAVYCIYPRNCVRAVNWCLGSRSCRDSARDRCRDAAVIMLTMRLVTLLEVADSHAIIAAMIEETMVSGLQSHGMLRPVANQ